MGRMLDMLKGGEARLAAPAPRPADETPEQERVVDWEIGEEVPFIEVGGPNKKVELSPGLAKHPPQSMPKPPHLAAEMPRAVSLAPPRSLTVAFEPWPGSAALPSAVAPEIAAYHQPDSPAAREYAGLLDAILAGAKPGATPALLFVGVRTGVGASTVLLNLGVVAARMRGLRVALVDAGDSHLAHRLGCGVSTGFSDVLEGALALEQAIVKTGIAALSVVPAGTKPGAINSEAMAWLLGWLKQRSDLVLIDGPTLDAADALARQAPNVQGVYLVVPKADAALARGVSPSITRAGGRLCGLVHTHFE